MPNIPTIAVKESRADLLEIGPSTGLSGFRLVYVIGKGLYRWRTGDQSSNVPGSNDSDAWVAPSEDTSGKSGAWNLEEPAMEKISTGTFSGASADITLPTGYSTHVLVITDFQPATDATDLQMRLDSASGASDYQFQTLLSRATATTSGRAAAAQAAVTEDLSNVAAEIMSGVLEIHNARNSGARTLVYCRTSFISAAGGMAQRFNSVQRIAEEDDTVLNLFMSSGNFSQGNYTLYGMR